VETEIVEWCGPAVG